MFFSNDLITNRHPQTRTFTDGFGGEKGVKNALLHWVWHTDSVVSDRYLHPSIVDRRSPNRNLVRGVFKFPIGAFSIHIVQGIQSIDQNIHEYLIELSGVTFHLGQSVIVFDYYHGWTIRSIFEPVLQNQQSALNSLMDINIFEVFFIHTIKVSQRDYNTSNSLGSYPYILNYLLDIFSEEFQIDFLCHCLHFWIVAGMALLIEFDHLQQVLGVFVQVSKITVDKVDRVIDFMGNSRNQLSQARHFFALDNLHLSFFQFV